MLPGGAIIITPEREQWWLGERDKCDATASEAAAIMGDPDAYESTLEVWLRKKGRITPKPVTQAMKVGKLLEPVIARLYEEETGCKIVHQQVWLRAGENPTLGATLDGIGEDGRLIEFKSLDARSTELGEEWTDDVPSRWIWQAQAQMLVADYAGELLSDRVDVAVLKGRNFTVHPVDRQEKLIERLQERFEWFHDLLQRDVPPEPTCAGDARLMPVLNPECHGDVELDGRIERCWEAYLDAKEMAKQEAEDEKTFKAAIDAAMGTAKFGHLPNGTTVIRTLVNVREHIRPASHVASFSYTKFTEKKEVERVEPERV